jgi:hypothetical protein
MLSVSGKAKSDIAGLLSPEAYAIWIRAEDEYRDEFGFAVARGMVTLFEVVNELNKRARKAA